MTWWKDRIIGYGKVDPKSLLANKANYRKHPAVQRRALEAVIKELGYVQPILVNKRTNTIVDGHLRVELAYEHFIAEIPVIYIDVSQEEELKLLGTLDPITNMATIDQSMFDDLLMTISSESQVINDMWDSMKKEKLIPTSYEYHLPLNAVASNVPPPPTAPSVNPYDIYTGMPEYQHTDKGSHQSIVVHLKDSDAVREFCERVGQTITPKTRYIWFPFEERGDFTNDGYVSE